jgi:hypothetical protein
VWTGIGIVRESVRGLMDTALPAASGALRDALDRYRDQGIHYHALPHASRAPSASRPCT